MNSKLILALAICLVACPSLFAQTAQTKPAQKVQEKQKQSEPELTAKEKKKRAEAKKEAEELARKIAERDFQYQGEYAGEMGTGKDKHKMGMQVIAIGNGKFRVVAYNQGLPGAGWNLAKHEEIKAVGKLKDGIVEFRGYARGNADIHPDGKMKFTTPDGTDYGTLEKVSRKSETLGVKPPEGAVVLFDGKNTDQWKNGKMTDDGLLMQGTTSKQKFGSHQLHIEFQLPFMPTKSGQGRGNSGCYVQGRYEIQMLDSFGLEGKQNECGGIYSVKAPDLNMCLPPRRWQTYDIDFTAAEFANGKQTKAARMTVRHNGVVIHDDVELPNRKTTAAPVNPSAEPGPIYLQNHGAQVRYRNIWVVPK